jgi:hypothetical protein
MTRCFIAAVFVLATAATALAQIAGGNLTGTIEDEQGGVLTRAAVTLIGPDRTTDATTDAAGKFRFLNLAPGSYRIAVTHPGFSDFIQENIDVRVGGTSDVMVTMKLAGVQESITVGAVAQAPIVDPRTTGTSTNFTLPELQRIPTSRDPFAIIRTVPGVLVDRVNIAGNETGQQAAVLAKGTRPADTVWTVDGVVITDLASSGVSPIYYNQDNFEEIHVSTAGQDIRQPTGGLGVNFVVRRGTNDFHGVVRGYFTNDALEWQNVPDELRAVGVSGATADHNEQITDYGFDFGGPLVRDSLWFYGSYSEQDVRLIRTRLVDRTRIKNPYFKLNWQASRRDLLSFLYYDGDKVKEGRIPSGSGSVVFHAPTALQNQSNAYADNPFHGLWKVEDNHTWGSALFTSAKFAYFNTGFELLPEGGLDQSSGRSVLLSRSFGSVNQARNVRPQWTTTLDAVAFRAGRGMSHDIKFGLGWRRVDAIAETVWPGNALLALENSATDRRVRIFRQGRGANRVQTAHVYVGDTMQYNRLTVDAGLRFDHQTGDALPSSTASNPVFPALVPGLEFPGYELPFSWNNLSPRAGFTYALRENRRWLVRGSVSRFAGQITTAIPGWANQSFMVGSRDYRWNDLNGDHLATPEEVLLDQFIAAGGGLNVNNPTAITSSFRYADDVEAPVTTSAVAGFEWDPTPLIGMSVNYSHSRTTNHIGNVATRVGLTRADYSPGPTLSGRLPDGLTYGIPTWIPNPAAVAAGGGGFLLDNWEGYTTRYDGVEAAVVRRLSGRWMARISYNFNNAREFYEPEAMYNLLGNPTRTDGEPLVDGGQFALKSGTAGDVFLNSRWQFNLAAMYILPQDIEIAANVFGRQGYPFPVFRNVAVGADAFPVLVTPQVDTYRLPNLWNTDLRVARGFEVKGAEMRLMADLFNVFNANTALIRVRNADAPNFRALAQNLSPRILRLGVTVGF